MPTARELLEQADALMRRNRSSAADDIPVLTDSVALPSGQPLAVVTPANARQAEPDAGASGVPVLTETVEVIDEPADESPVAVAEEGEPSDWLESERGEPSAIGDAPDSIVIVPSVLRATPRGEAAQPPATFEEIELTSPAEEDFEEEFDDAVAHRESPAVLDLRLGGHAAAVTATATAEPTHVALASAADEEVRAYDVADDLADERASGAGTVADGDRDVFADDTDVADAAASAADADGDAFEPGAASAAVPEDSDAGSPGAQDAEAAGDGRDQGVASDHSASDDAHVERTEVPDGESASGHAGVHAEDEHAAAEHDHEHEAVPQAGPGDRADRAPQFAEGHAAMTALASPSAVGLPLQTAAFRLAPDGAGATSVPYAIALPAAPAAPPPATTVSTPAPPDPAAVAAEQAKWDSLAEEVRMQVLQRIDLFTDTGLRDQLALRLQPIVDRASAELVATINQHIGLLLRGYVAEAIEREIENWRRNQ